MHGHWLISLGQQEHMFLGSALHLIQITLFTYSTSLPTFANAQVGSVCRMQFRPNDIAVSPDTLKLS